jgi:hypothetical protein
MSSCTSLFVISDDVHLVLSSILHTMVYFFEESDPAESQETV